jgi:hypothetical protein
MHRRSLERFDFDSILLPWNWFAAHHRTYAPDFAQTLKLAGERNLAVQTIKGVARGPWAANVKRDRNTWYQPLEAPADARQDAGERTPRLVPAVGQRRRHPALIRPR